MSERVRAAVPADVDAITAMAADRRSRYAKYQPVFWRPAPDAEQVHRPYLAELIDDKDVITLVADDSGTVAGFLNSDHRRRTLCLRSRRPDLHDR